MMHVWRVKLRAGVLGAGLAVAPLTLMAQTPAPTATPAAPAPAQGTATAPAAAPAAASAEGAQQSAEHFPAAASGVTAPAAATPAPAPAPPADYLIGTDDVLSIVFWKDKDMTTDVVVRPDGRISLPVLNELAAAGLTPEQLRTSILTAAAKYFEDPSVNIVVKQINSRRVSITGEVSKPGLYPLGGGMTVIQLIAAAGGLNEYAKSDKIAVIRTEGGKQTRFRVNYKDVINGKNLKQNIELEGRRRHHRPVGCR